ncbi:MAG: lysylphosphatidylglycerol synthase transmembrane domain-containing protein, partial [Candidatus Natronoplasma sp.]
MEKKFLEFFGLLTIGILVVIVVYSMVGFDQIINSIALMDPYSYFLVIILIILSIFLWSVRWGIFVRKNNPEVTYSDLFKIQLVGQAMNNLTPIFKMGGEAGKLYLLKRKYEIKVREGLASVSTDLTLE